MEGNCACLYLAILHINLVAAEDNWDVLANANKVTIPAFNIVVCQTRCHIEHDNGTLALNVVPITKTSKALLTSSIPAKNTTNH